MSALPEQAAFLERAMDSHALLVAGPGTGKTWTLAEAARRLADERGVPRDTLAVVTLTRSLAGSLSERIPHGSAGTLHSFALWHLNRLGEAWGRRVVDPWEQRQLVRIDLRLGVYASFGIRPTMAQVDDFLSALGSAFRDAQAEPPDMSPVERRLFEVFQQQRELFRYRLMDELVNNLVELLEQGVRLEKAPTYTVVDEYQDLTPGELQLLQLLSELHGSRIIAAGDDRQSIFGFREADPRALHRFPEVYGVPTDPLHRSNRCPRQVCEFAEAVAESLPPLPGMDRPALEPWPGREDPGEVRIFTSRGPVAEAKWVVRECHSLVDTGGVPPSDMMVVVAGFFDPVFYHICRVAQRTENLPFFYYDPRSLDPAANCQAGRLLMAGARLLVDAADQMAWRALVWATPGIGERRLQRILTANQRSFLANLNLTAPRDSRALLTGIASRPARHDTS
jgi:superfamily I DNA/RNA helicase